MSRLKFFVVSLVLFCSITVAYPVEVFLPIQGDLDKDGDVDFQDFLIFAGNFGKEGPVPHDLKLISQRERASKILGEWRFNFGGDGGLGGATFGWDFMIGSLGLMRDTTEVVYRAYRYNGLPATGYYVKDRDEYSILYIQGNTTWFFLFAIEEIRIYDSPVSLQTITQVTSGNVYRFNNTTQTIEEARVLPILDRSGKFYRVYGETPTDIDYNLPASKPSTLRQEGVPLYVVGAFEKLNGIISR